MLENFRADIDRYVNIPLLCQSLHLVGFVWHKIVESIPYNVKLVGDLNG